MRRALGWLAVVGAAVGLQGAAVAGLGGAPSVRGAAATLLVVVLLELRAYVPRLAKVGARRVETEMRYRWLPTGAPPVPVTDEPPAGPPKTVTGSSGEWRLGVVQRRGALQSRPLPRIDPLEDETDDDTVRETPESRRRREEP